MDIAVQVAIISAAASIIAGLVTFVLNKHAERKDALQLRKLEHYKILLSAISNLAIDGEDRDEASKNFAQASNTIALVAPQAVITALMDFHDEVSPSNVNKTLKGEQEKLIKLLLELRKSLDLPFKDHPQTFSFHLIGANPRRYINHRNNS
ncbi:MAG: hypothetical protein CMJ19_07710 [Phycisphaeraceae bacterium]|nr:hypothetical protein [Phycisphaeraceae bacterium]